MLTGAKKPMTLPSLSRISVRLVACRSKARADSVAISDNMIGLPHKTKRSRTSGWVFGPFPFHEHCSRTVDQIHLVGTTTRACCRAKQECGLVVHGLPMSPDRATVPDRASPETHGAMGDRATTASKVRLQLPPFWLI